MSITVGGAIEPLLRYLSSAIGDEALLLGGVHRDAQFIQDELESMNAFLHHLAEASTDHDYQVRPWRKQVRDLAIDTQYCIDLYAHRVGRAPRARGVWGHVHRAIFFLQTIPERHQVATQIQELKTRARDISERRQRYGTQVPPKVTNEIGGGSGSGGGIGGNALLLHNAYRRGLVDVEPDLKDDTFFLINWLWKEALLHAEEPEAGPGQPIAVIAVVAPDKADDGDLAKEVYNHSSLMRLFDCKAFVTIQRPLFLPQVLDDMIQQLRIPHEAESDGEQQLREELKRQVKGRRFFVVVENADHPYPWNEMKDILASSGCSPGSVIMVTTKDSVLAQRFSPDRTMTHSFVQVCSGKANRLVSTEWDAEKRAIMHHVLQKCDPDLFCMRLFLGALYINPYISKNQLVDLCTSLDSSSAWPDDGTATSTCIRMKMMRFCYDMLPKMIRTCLLYLSIFPPNFCFRRTSLVRRWVAEGPVIQGDGPELALDTAERCFDDLVALGFVAIAEAGNLDNVISCKVHRFVHDFITKVVKEESLGDERLPASLAGHLSVSSYVQMRLEQQQGDTNDITTFIESLPRISRAASLKMMDLDYCKHLKDQHLKIICNNLFLLKYLSIRSTGISQLPPEINKLQQLETLDIRQTRVTSSATKGLLIPMLKHLLAGPTSYRVGASPEEEFSTVRMPCKIGKMIKMETLYHVEVAKDDEEKLEHVKNLKRLRNLGVVIHGKQDNINRLLRAVTELSECLRKLSVWVRPCRDDMVLLMGIETKYSLPKSLEILSINGITRGLPNWIEDLPHLTEISLCQTFLSDGSMRVLGKREGLRCLTLRHKSYTEHRLTFKTNEFKNINFLVIQGASDIKRIIFETGTAPKLAKIVWTFISMDITADPIIGLGDLPNLKKLEFNGDFDPSHMQRAAALHPNCPDFRYNIDVPVNE